MKKLHSPRRGSVTLEYACILAVVLAIAIPVLAKLGSAMNDPLNSVNELGSVKTAADDRPARPAADVSRFSVRTPSLLEQMYLAEIVLMTAVCLVAVYTLRRYRLGKIKGAGHDPIGQSVASMSRDLFNKREQIQLAVSMHWDSGLGNQLLVADLMTRGPRCIEPDMPRSKIADLMDKTKLHHLLVTKEGVLVGVLSASDMAERPGQTASEIMSANPSSVNPFTPVTDAINIMLAHHFASLPVVEGDTPCGILTMSDIAMGLQCTLRVLEKIGTAISIDKSQGNGEVVSGHPQAVTV